MAPQKAGERHRNHGFCYQNLSYLGTSPKIIIVNYLGANYIGITTQYIYFSPFLSHIHAHAHTYIICIYPS